MSLSAEETRDVEKELDNIDNKFDDARAANLKIIIYKSRGKDCTNANWGLISQKAQVCKPGLSLCMLRGSEYNIMQKLLTLRFCCLFVWVEGWHPLQVV